MAYPADIYTQTNVQGTTLLATDDHATRHNAIGTEVVGIETVMGVNSGTSVLKNFVSGDFAARINNETFGSPTINGGTVNITGLRPPYITVGTANADYVCDGTDDHLQIGSAITAVSAMGGGIVFMKAGTYDIAGTVALANNVYLQGYGAATFCNVDTLAAFSINGISNSGISNIKMDFNAQTTNDYGIKILNSSDIFIEKNILNNCQSFGIFTHSTSPGTTQRVWIRDNYLNGLGNGDVIGGGVNDSSGSCAVKDILVENNVITQDAAQGGNYPVCIDMVGVERVSFINNKTYGDIYFGSEQFPNAHSIMSGNIIQKAVNGTVGCELGIISGNANTAANYHDIISNNVINDGDIKVSAGTAFKKANRMIITGNNISRTTNFGIIGYWLEHSIISNNIVAATTSGTIIGAIDLEDSTYNLISNNQVFREGTSGTIQYAYREGGTCDYNLVIGNIFSNAGTAVGTTGANDVSQHNITT